MNSSLVEKCFEQISSQKSNNIFEKVSKHLYDQYVDYLTVGNFNQWKDKIKSVNLEINIEDIEVNYDMYFDEPTYHIFIKKKVENDYDDYEEEIDDFEKEFILFHEFQDETGLYDYYYDIAEKRNLIDKESVLDEM